MAFSPPKRTLRRPVFLSSLLQTRYAPCLHPALCMQAALDGPTGRTLYGHQVCPDLPPYFSGEPLHLVIGFPEDPRGRGRGRTAEVRVWRLTQFLISSSDARIEWLLQTPRRARCAGPRCGGEMGQPMGIVAVRGTYVRLFHFVVPSYSSIKGERKRNSTHSDCHCFHLYILSSATSSVP